MFFHYLDNKGAWRDIFVRVNFSLIGLIGWWYLFSLSLFSKTIFKLRHFFQSIVSLYKSLSAHPPTKQSRHTNCITMQKLTYVTLSSVQKQFIKNFTYICMHKLEHRNTTLNKTNFYSKLCRSPLVTSGCGMAWRSVLHHLSPPIFHLPVSAKHTWWTCALCWANSSCCLIN